MNHALKYLTSITFIILLSACGGGGSSDSQNSSGNEPHTSNPPPKDELYQYTQVIESYNGIQELMLVNKDTIPVFFKHFFLLAEEFHPEYLWEDELESLEEPLCLGVWEHLINRYG